MGNPIIQNELVHAQMDKDIAGAGLDVSHFLRLVHYGGSTL